MKEIILSIMLNFISDNYGIQEMEEPCYDMEKMAAEVSSVLEKTDILNKKEVMDTYEL